MTKSEKPPQFRGSDFAIRYEQGRWSEDRIMDAVNNTAGYRAIPYGRSQVGPEDPEALADYWAAYRLAESHGKRPDILIVQLADHERLNAVLAQFDDPTIANDVELRPLLDAAICGLEAENSLWHADLMPDYGKWPITKAAPVAPTVWIKEQDLQPLLEWREKYGIPIFVVQVFYDRAFVVDLGWVARMVADLERQLMTVEDPKLRRRLELRLSKESGLRKSAQEYPDSRTGARPKKVVYRAHHLVTVPFGVLDPDDPVGFSAQVVEEKNGKVIPYVAFSGGRLILTAEAIALFDRLATEKVADA